MRAYLLLFILSCGWLHAVGADIVTLPMGTVVYSNSFHNASSIKGVYPGANYSLVAGGYNGFTALKVIVDKPVNGTNAHSNVITFFNIMNTSYVAGTTLQVVVRVKAEGVTMPLSNNNGIKCALVIYIAGQAQPDYGEANNVSGTFDWSTSTYGPYYASINPNVSRIDLVMGMQESWGTVYFDSVNITVWRAAPPVNPPAPWTGHPNIPRLRGVMSPTSFDEPTIANLATWGANTMRWQINGIDYTTVNTIAKYDAWLQGKINETEKALAACAKYGIMCVVDLHALPPAEGPLACDGSAWICNLAAQNYTLNIWEVMARRFKGQKALWAYDLGNEPVQTSQSNDSRVLNYRELVLKLVSIIRNIDQDVTIAYESLAMANPKEFNNFVPISDNKTIYSIHMYDPSTFTHQGVLKGFTYPGPVWPSDGSGKATIKWYLRYVRTFQLSFNVNIYVGEFSAVRWATSGSAVYWLKDCIEVFEEYGWDYAYHAYREWHGWSVEYDEDKNNTVMVTYNTTRKLLLLEYFGKNVIPNFNPTIAPTASPTGTPTSNPSNNSTDPPTIPPTTTPTSPPTSTPGPVLSSNAATIGLSLLLLIAIVIVI